MKDAIARFLTAWGSNLAIVGAGVALGLLVVFLAWEESSQSPRKDSDQSSVVTVEPAKPKIDKPPPKHGLQAATPTAPKTAQISEAKTPVSSDRTADQPDWQRFAAVHSPILGRRMIAVIIDDMGLDFARTARAIELVGPLTMSFLTYARNLKAQVAAARSAGHELMIHLPMEPEDTDAYAGPKVIKRDLSEEELKRRLKWAFGRFEGYVGINNHMGSRYTADRPGMMLVLAEIKRRGLLFIDSRTSGNSVAPSVARQLAVPFAQRHVFLDDDPTSGSIIRQLKALEGVARKQGFGIAIGHPRDTTISELEKWLPTLSSRGFVLVPVSAIVRHRGQEAG